MLDMVFDLFTENDRISLLESIEDKNVLSRKIMIEGANYYNRFPIPEHLENKKLMEKFLHEKYSRTYLFKDSWINKVTIDTNKDDAYHFDMSNLTIVTYLNDDFEGGEFEYLDDFKSKVKITPKKNLSLIMNGYLKHRVLPVSKGERYSLVSFFDVIKKNKNTMI
jgi:predicted 2-oxoglutarate/Fe(II)-dependent dioxygenase YbiX